MPSDPTRVAPMSEKSPHERLRESIAFALADSIFGAEAYHYRAADRVMKILRTFLAREGHHDIAAWLSETVPVNSARAR